MRRSIFSKAVSPSEVGINKVAILSPFFLFYPQLFSFSTSSDKISYSYILCSSSRCFWLNIIKSLSDAYSGNSSCLFIASRSDSKWQSVFPHLPLPFLPFWFYGFVLCALRNSICFRCHFSTSFVVALTLEFEISSSRRLSIFCIVKIVNAT